MNVNKPQGWSAKKMNLLLEPNVDAQDWTFFRLLISTNDDVATNRYKCKIRHMKPYYGKKNVEVDYHSVATGVGVGLIPDLKKENMFLNE